MTSPNLYRPAPQARLRRAPLPAALATAAVLLLALSLPVAAGAPGTSATAPVAADAPQWRCGWFENPTPGNAWLADRHGEWLVGVQGGHQAEGDWPEFRRGRWVKTNGSYGYGCACLRVVVDAAEQQVLRIDEAHSRPLSACRRDRRLPKPGMP